MKRLDTLVCGVASRGGLPTKDSNGKILKSYNAWVNMINRCYNPIHKGRYKTSTVCTEWLYYPNFKKWYDDNYIEGYALDKDIHSPLSRTYSRETCCYIPRSLNILLGMFKNEWLPRGTSYNRRTGKIIISCPLIDIDKLITKLVICKRIQIAPVAYAHYAEGNITINTLARLLEWNRF